MTGFSTTTRAKRLGLTASSLLLSATLLAACAPREPVSHANAAAETACRARVDDMFVRQNRAILYRDNQQGLPFAAGGAKTVSTDELSQRYAYGNAVSDCLSGASGRQGASGTVAPVAPAPVAAPPSTASAPTTSVPSAPTPGVKPGLIAPGGAPPPPGLLPAAPKG